MRSRNSSLHCRSGGEAYGFSAGLIVTLPQSGVFVVSKDPTFDDVYISVIRLSPTSVPFGTAQQWRVPIGSRP